MIKVNGKDSEWKEGLTVQDILEQKKYTFPKIIVRVNGSIIPPEEYSRTIIYDGDDIIAFHLLAGG